MSFHFKCRFGDGEVGGDGIPGKTVVVFILAVAVYDGPIQIILPYVIHCNNKNVNVIFIVFVNSASGMNIMNRTNKSTNIKNTE